MDMDALKGLLEYIGFIVAAVVGFLLNTLVSFYKAQRVKADTDVVIKSTKRDDFRTILEAYGEILTRLEKNIDSLQAELEECQKSNSEMTIQLRQVRIEEIRRKHNGNGGGNGE